MNFKFLTDLSRSLATSLHDSIPFQYLNFVITRITLFGALFLGTVAILPNILQAATGIQALIAGGTSVLIVVAVVIETVKILETQLVSRSYDRYSK